MCNLRRWTCLSSCRGPRGPCAAGVAVTGVVGWPAAAGAAWPDDSPPLADAVLAHGWKCGQHNMKGEVRNTEVIGMG